MGEEHRFWLLQIYDNKKIWVKLHFWHPLKPRYIFYILFLFAAILLAFLVDFYFFSRLSERESSFAFTFSIAGSVLIAIFIFYFTQEEIKRLEYSDALKKLLIELGENKINLDQFATNVNIRFKELEEEKTWNWMPKQDSYTNWASNENFQYKYFATSAYFNFVNQGHILNTKYLSIPKGNIANIYESYFQFNTQLQKLENIIHNFDDFKKYNPPDTIINKLSIPLIKEEICLYVTLPNNGYIFNNKTYYFENKKDIQRFLKCDFYNHYANDFLNGGIIKNHQIVYDQLAKYFDFQNKEIRD
ncbi:MAG: hypothetical protein PHI15_06900 [Methanomicrobium sp.]|nr:hypothetical protein [Methanomicrobium sp.]